MSALWERAISFQEGAGAAGTEKGILSEAASFLCLVLTGPQPLLLSLQMHILARASVPPCHVLTSLSFLTETQQSQEEKKNRIPDI